MKWNNIRQKAPKVFQRLTGVKKEVFKIMVSELKRLSPGSEHKIQGKKRGPKPITVRNLKNDSKVSFQMFVFNAKNSSLTFTKNLFAHVSNTFGPKPTLKKEDELLMMLMYYREYRTFFHIAQDYGISEPQCWRIVTQTESLLLKSKKIHWSQSLVETMRFQRKTFSCYPIC